MLILSHRGYHEEVPENTEEAFELAHLLDETRNHDPLADANLMRAAQRLLDELCPALLLITLGDLGTLPSVTYLEKDS